VVYGMNDLGQNTRTRGGTTKTQQQSSSGGGGLKKLGSFFKNLLP